eukprot:3608217-Amphidinium_carterae.1
MQRQARETSPDTILVYGFLQVGAFKKVMSSVKRHEPLVITSSKSNIGHSEGGAGLATASHARVLT